MTTVEERPMTAGRAMSIAALLLSVSVALSRVLGYARDAVLAWELGVSGQTDAYYAAFLLPDLLHYLMAGGALSITFVPMHTRLIAAGRDDRAWSLFWTILVGMVVVLGALSAVAFAFAPALVAWLYPTFNADQLALTTYLTRVLLPGPVLFVVGGLLTATELTRKRFWAPALAPLLYNLATIVGGVIGVQLGFGVVGFAWGVLAGAALGPFLTPAVLAARHLRWRWSSTELGTDVRRYVWLALPLMVGASLLTVDEWFGRRLGSQLPEGSISVLNNARRLMLVPVALVGQAAGQAALPFLAQLAADARHEALHRLNARAVHVTAALAACASAGLWVAALPAVRLFYERGAFDSMWSLATASALQWMTLAIVPWCVLLVVLRSFYAQEQTALPMLVQTVVVLLSWPLYAWLAASYQVDGLAAATGVGLALAAAAILALHRVLYGESPVAAALAGTAQGAIAGAGGVAGWWTLTTMVAALGVSPSTTAGAGLTLAAGTLGFAVASLPLLVRIAPPVREMVVPRVGRVTRRLLRR